MRSIDFTTRFKRDFKREKKGRHHATIDADLSFVVDHLLSDRALPDRFRDHVLGGEWKDCRDCHIRPDLILIYSTATVGTLLLVRLGSHSELGL